jgi:hypothetical protein
MPSVAFLVLGLALFVMLLAPTRRLQRAGWPPRALGGYLAGMLGLGLAVAFLPISARFVVPILILGYLAPFVVAATGIERLRGRSRSTVTVGRPPIKTVSGPARDLPTEPPTTEDEAASQADRRPPAGRP